MGIIPPLGQTSVFGWRNNLVDKINRKLILTHRKDLVKGDILIDDRPNNGAKDFEGEWIHFGSDTYPNWEITLKHLL